MTNQKQSLIDSNIEWFTKESSHETLKSIQLVKGSLRSLTKFKVEFKYPITAIAGLNGSGKSTILALAACAYSKDRNKSKNSIGNYFRLSEFLVQSSGETPPSGIQIDYEILSNKWRDRNPGCYKITRSKIEGKSKWSNFKFSVPRNVVYLGLNRAVPHFERKTHKSYKRQFASVQTQNVREVSNLASRIMGKNYSSYTNRKHLKHDLPFVTSDGG